MGFSYSRDSEGVYNSDQNIREFGRAIPRGGSERNGTETRKEELVWLNNE